MNEFVTFQIIRLNLESQTPIRLNGVHTNIWQTAVKISANQYDAIDVG